MTVADKCSFITSFTKRLSSSGTLGPCILHDMAGTRFIQMRERVTQQRLLLGNQHPQGEKSLFLVDKWAVIHQVSRPYEPNLELIPVNLNQEKRPYPREYALAQEKALEESSLVHQEKALKGTTLAHPIPWTQHMFWECCTDCFCPGYHLRTTLCSTPQRVSPYWDLPVYYNWQHKSNYNT